jgi:hypothetical protein
MMDDPYRANGLIIEQFQKNNYNKIKEKDWYP